MVKFDFCSKLNIITGIQLSRLRIFAVTHVNCCSRVLRYACIVYLYLSLATVYFEAIKSLLHVCITFSLLRSRGRSGKYFEKKKSKQNGEMMHLYIPGVSRFKDDDDIGKTLHRVPLTFSVHPILFSTRVPPQSPHILCVRFYRLSLSDFFISVN